ncbi:MAG: ferrous iron transport protein [Bryobacterales bacterium]|nr:ferrous iron transport protein [Bryobacterales bacterium]
MTAPQLIQITPAPKVKLIALVGPPNCGKSTLFNRLTGLRQKVGNYPGVTVEQKLGRMQIPGGATEIVDLPGVTSFAGRSDDERVTVDVLNGKMRGLRQPDAVLLVLDATAIDRHLSLAAPVLALGLPTMVVLNFVDELEARGGAIDPAGLSAKLGVPVQLISAKLGQGLDRVRAFIAEIPKPEQDLDLPGLHDVPLRRRWASNTATIAGFRRPVKSIWTPRLDRIALHPYIGPLLFIVILTAVFQSISVLATPLQDFCETAIHASGTWIASVLPPSVFRSLLTEGVWPGVGSVLSFLPQILILFLFIGILEDSGYMTRAAVIADRTMSRFGLQGKAFIPLLSAYACAIPAIMATRTIEDKRDRLATILIAPFMTCSARLPVYTMIIAAFIPERPILGPLLGTRAAAMLGLYLLGFVGALGTAFLLKSTVLRSKPTTFMMEMPPYRWPLFRGLLFRLVDRGKAFVYRAGTIILVVTVVLWLLANFPLHNGQFSPIESSYAGMLGKTIEPFIRPLGFNWKIGVGLVTSLAAREVIIGTLGTLYGIEGTAGQPGGLAAALQRDITPGGAAALVVFFAFAMQCFSTLAVVRRETGSWKWPAIQFAYMTFVAYVSAWGTFALVTAIYH